MPLPTSLDPLSLTGTWELARVIDDHLADEVSRVEGSTGLTVEDDGRIRWVENGTLSRRGVELPVSRVLFLQRRGERGWFVTFEDGRDFHPWQPGHAVEHRCAPDHYVGLVEAADGGAWRVTWRVTGPRKDYTMTSTLRRGR
ncbi:DUF6314 family protein [Aeromicrobium sp.]|uniref:DUF6314 family protein n=1 Tax=Aeromicrobium sp. TaxID=1871063 RepID=UPI0019949860|nr:DUF6314 family protein [Aeromicrobium sp.]MBC7633475.1 hypothetical protein [Aeromicrobium sp.]